jgi:hypothetical protein
VASAAVLVGGCGLEVVAFLAPPVVTNPADGIIPEYGFSHNTDTNDEIFLGFEVFYKFYSPDPDVYVQAYDADIDAITAQFTSSPTTILRQRGYNRIVNPAVDDPTNQELPLLEVPASFRATAFEVVLNFPGDAVTPAPGRAEFSFNDETVLLYRTAREGTGFQSFTPDEVETADSDVRNTITDTTGIALGLVVMSYGRDRSTFPAPQLYSEPVALGIAPLLN